MSASRSAANSPLRCSSHRSAASPSSPDDRQLARARLFLRRKRRTPTGPSSAPSPQQIALNDPLEASRAATAASLSSDRFRHRESISSCLPFSTLTQPALVLFPNQIRIYSQQAPSIVNNGPGTYPPASVFDNRSPSLKQQGRLYPARPNQGRAKVKHGKNVVRNIMGVQVRGSRESHVRDERHDDHHLPQAALPDPAHRWR